MTDVITVQPTSKDYLPVEPDNVDVSAGIEDKENEEKAKEELKRMSRSTYVDPNCCCYLDEHDFLFHFWCCRMISNCFVGCGHCTESCCESCCVCCAGGDTTDAVAQPASSGCCEGQEGCCGDACCSCNDCGDCDCGDCDCGDCDCSGCDCDCSCFG